MNSAQEHMGVPIGPGYRRMLRRYLYIVVWNFFKLRLDRKVGGTIALLALVTYLLFIFSVTPFFAGWSLLGLDLHALLCPAFQLAGVLWYSFVIIVVWLMASVSSLAGELPRKCKNWNAEIEKWYKAEVEQLGPARSSIL